MKMSVQFNAFNGYFVVNIKIWIGVHTHFRCFDIHKAVSNISNVRWMKFIPTRRSFINLIVKTALKSVYFWRSTDKNMLAPFYGPRGSISDGPYNAVFVLIRRKIYSTYLADAVDAISLSWFTSAQHPPGRKHNRHRTGIDTVSVILDGYK